MTTTDYILQLVTMFGGLALFLFGMDIMGKSLERQAGGKLQTILAKMSSTVAKGLLLGLAVTAVIQSSSATTVMTVGFVNSGIMTLRQAVGVIMGSNIGTTVTSWVLSLSALEGDSFIVQLFKPSTLAPILGVIGIVLYMFTKSEKKKGIGSILLGFMSLMTGMQIMSGAMKFLEHEEWFAQLMISFSNPIVGIAVGAILTAVIQSSSASVGILQGLCSTGLVSFGTAIPIILGQNIGTCVTAMISTIGATTNAKRTAMVHLYFNLLGTIIFAILFYTVNVFFPWQFLADGANEMGIALVHTGFNVITTAFFLPFHGLLEKLAVASVRDSGKKEETVLLDERLLATPAVAISRCADIAHEMADKVVRCFELACELVSEYDEKKMSQLRSLEDETDKYEDALGTYLVNLSSENLNYEDNKLLNTLLYAIGDFERIADHAVSLGASGREIAEKPVIFSDMAKSELKVLRSAVSSVVDKTISAFYEKSTEKAFTVEPNEQVVDGIVKDIKSRHIKRLRKGQCSVEYGFVLDDILTSYSRIADHCSNIAGEILQLAEGKLALHGYFGDLREGRLTESQLFDSYFNEYKNTFLLPTEE